MRDITDPKHKDYVKQVTPNPNEIQAIKRDSLERFDMFWKQKDTKNMAKYVFENLYEALRELPECITLNEGLKIYAHDLVISHLKRGNHLSEEDAEAFDSIRRMRNQSKYYGKDISFEKLQETLDDFRRLKQALERLLIKTTQ